MKKGILHLFTLIFLALLFSQTGFAQGSVGQLPALDINRNNSWDPILQQNAAVIEGDTIGDLRFQGFVLDGYYHPSAKIRTYVSGPVGNNSVPGNLIFMTGTPWPVMRMTVAHNGNVGVNTFAPAELFTVSDETPVVRWEKSGTDAMDYEIYGGTDGGLFFRGGADDNGPGLTDYMVLTAIGRLGLGTNTPDQLLTISDESPVFRLESDVAADYEVYNQSGNLLFRGGANGTGGALTDFMVLTGSGNLGVGTTSPQRLLTISAEDETAFRFDRTAGKDVELIAGADGDLYFNGGANGTGSDLNNLMLLKNDGRLILGTELMPADYLLSVGGAVICEEVKVALQADWPDYVFTDEYTRPSLEEVDEHIQQNGHLPNIPSAREVQENGLNLSEMAVVQQEKIEEIYLHLIDMNEQIKALQAENEQLKAANAALAQQKGKKRH